MMHEKCVSCRSSLSFTPYGISISVPGIPVWKCDACGVPHISKVALNALNFHMGYLYRIIHESKSLSELDSVLPDPQDRSIVNVVGGD